MPVLSRPARSGIGVLGFAVAAGAFAAGLAALDAAGFPAELLTRTLTPWPANRPTSGCSPRWG